MRRLALVSATARLSYSQGEKQGNNKLQHTLHQVKSTLLLLALPLDHLQAQSHISVSTQAKDLPPRQNETTHTTMIHSKSEPVSALEDGEDVLVTEDEDGGYSGWDLRAEEMD